MGQLEFEEIRVLFIKYDYEKNTLKVNPSYCTLIDQFTQSRRYESSTNQRISKEKRFTFFIIKKCKKSIFLKILKNNNYESYLCPITTKVANLFESMCEMINFNAHCGWQKKKSMEPYYIIKIYINCIVLVFLCLYDRVMGTQEDLLRERGCPPLL